MLDQGATVDFRRSFDDLRAIREVMVRRVLALNAWLDKRARAFHSMEHTFATLRASERRVMPVTCEPTFEAPRDEAWAELIRCLS
jgi:hypothetical protein